jgi:hypothetical protein
MLAAQADVRVDEMWMRCLLGVVIDTSVGCAAGGWMDVDVGRKEEDRREEERRGSSICCRYLAPLPNDALSW